MFELRRLAGISERGHAVNEDVAGFSRQNAWLLDGATSFERAVVDPRSDARWFVRLADATFAETFGNDEATPLVDAGERVATLARHELRTVCSEGVPPSASVALCQLRDSELEFLQLGDVVTVVCDEACVVDDEANSLIEQERKRVTAGRLRISERALASRLREARRTRMNVDGGFWILSDEPVALAHARRRSVSARPGMRILLCSDGFARVVSWFSLVDKWENLVRELVGGSGPQLIRRLRQIEDEHPMMSGVPATVRHDDATALVLEVVEAAR